MAESSRSDPRLARNVYETYESHSFETDPGLTRRRRMRTTLALFAATLILIACAAAGTAETKDGETGPGTAMPTASESALPTSFAPAALDDKNGVAIFAGGCFWCVESEYDDLPGVVAAISGYIGGPELNPAYKQVAAGKTGHTEAVRIVFDPAVVTYAQLLDLFWKNHDPFRKNAQFCDRGTQYRPGIFPLNAAQRELAHRTKGEVAERFGEDVVTEVTDAGVFWTAEDYHQDFHHKNPSHYQRYRMGCGRDARLKELWSESK